MKSYHDFLRLEAIRVEVRMNMEHAVGTNAIPGRVGPTGLVIPVYLLSKAVVGIGPEMVK
jgi:hypothetical protein